MILQGDALTKLKELPEKSINMCMTSPPYWALRDYGDGNAIIWGGKEDCGHEWVVHKTPPRGGHCHPDRPPKVGANKDEMLKGTSARFGYDSNFCNKCGAWKGQLGLEPTFDQYILNLCDIFDEVKRVLRDDGTCWVNIGDTYGGHPVSGKQGGFQGKYTRDNPSISNVKKPKIMPKSLIMIPFRFAIEMVNRGWILRNTIIWHKPNCMPSSVKDRFTVDFEYLFFFSKKKKYYFETQYEPRLTEPIKDLERIRNQQTGNNKHSQGGVMAYKNTLSDEEILNQASKGRNKRTVWQICPKPFSEAHFAVYPEELCETPIKAGCPEFVCVKCGKAREKIMKVANLREGDNAELIVKDDPYAVNHRKGTIMVRKLPKEQEIIDYLREWKGDITYKDLSKHTGLAVTSVSHWFSDIDSTHGFSYPTKNEWLKLKDLFQFGDKYDKAMTKEYVKPAGVMDTEYEVEGLSDCGCNTNFTSGIVLDPFFGAGTTGLVALKQNKQFIGIELNPEYIEIAEKRLKPYLEQKTLSSLPSQENK